MKVTTEVVAFPEFVSMREVFGKDLMAITRATGAKWEFNAVDKTIKIRGSPKSIEQSIKAMNKRLGLHLGRFASDSTSEREPGSEGEKGAAAAPQRAPLHVRSISSQTRSVGLKGIAKEVARENAAAAIMRSKSFSGKPSPRETPSGTAVVPPRTTPAAIPVSADGLPRYYFVIRDTVATHEGLSFLPVLNAAGNTLPYATLQKVNRPLGSAGAGDAASLPGVFNHESKAVVVLKTLMMLVSSKAFFDERASLRVHLGRQRFARSRHAPLPSSCEVLGVADLQMIPQKSIRPWFDEQLTRETTAAIERYVVEQLGLRFCGERTEVRARIVDHDREAVFDVVFDTCQEKNLTDGVTPLVLLKVSRTSGTQEHATYLSASRDVLDLRVQAVGREIVYDAKSKSPEAAAAGSRARARTRTIGAGNAPAAVLDDATRREFTTFLRQFRLRKAVPPHTPTGGSAPARLRGGADRWELIYPIDGTMFSVETYQKLRKRTFEGGRCRQSAEGSFPVRVIIVRVDHPDGTRNFRVAGSCPALSAALRKGKPDFPALQALVDVFKGITGVDPDATSPRPLAGSFPAVAPSG